MKENWINKLLELLNQYTKEEKESDIIWELDNDWDICHKYKESVDYNDCIYYAKIPVLISKSYGFIKRLIKNNKIDLSKLWKKSYMWFGDKYTREESLLMILSISNTPIKDLISVLK